MKSVLSISCGAAAMLLAGGTAFAGLTNSGFETGNFSGWTVSGVAASAVRNTEFSRDFLGNPQPPMPDDMWRPNEGRYFASLWSTDSNGVNSTSLSQDFHTDAGEMVCFAYFFDFGDFSPFNDSALCQWTDANGVTTTLFEINTPGHEIPSDTNIGWTMICFTAPAAGMNNLTFRVADANGSFESLLGVDFISVVPLPPAVWMGAAGLGLAGIVARRRAMRK